MRGPQRPALRIPAASHKVLHHLLQRLLDAPALIYFHNHAMISRHDRFNVQCARKNRRQSRQPPVLLQRVQILQNKIRLHMIPELIHTGNNLFKGSAGLRQLLNLKSNQALAAAGRIPS